MLAERQRAPSWQGGSIWKVGWGYDPLSSQQSVDSQVGQCIQPDLINPA